MTVDREHQRARKLRNSQARYARAAYVITKMTLGPLEADALAAERARTGECVADVIRRLLREAVAAGQSKPGMSA